MKRVFRFSLQQLSETFLDLKTIQCATIIKLHKPSCKVPVVIVGFLTWKFLDRFSKTVQTPNFMKIRPLGAR